MYARIPQIIILVWLLVCICPTVVLAKVPVFDGLSYKFWSWTEA